MHVYILKLGVAGQGEKNGTKNILHLAGRGSPPRANITGSDKATSVSLVPFVSEKAFPHSISIERSMSAAMNPLSPLVPRPIVFPTPGLCGEIEFNKLLLIKKGKGKTGHIQ